MYTEKNVPGPEFRVRPVVRYVVTRYCHPYQAEDGSHGMTGLSEVIAELPNEQRAFEVAQAMAKAEEHFAATVRSNE
jgi:hypothetical protein